MENVETAASAPFLSISKCRVLCRQVRVLRTFYSSSSFLIFNKASLSLSSLSLSLSLSL